ncbi:MAG TPA: DUF4143 domain-containing protein [Candidatus Corynebacterium gallistercoris]|uniref:DUF4143 domain-containing protein n=1 Tax=Candidatus Corynebacterium gallistercoris TaxID=2838530 RepID=A0A9D1RZQ9_9CORY|nr:DUF4143 domain-containing protein [Candidatus Corynebacterium gallistercoris]
MAYLERSVDRQLDYILQHVAAVSLEGPRGVGKTDTASRRAELRFSFDSEADIERFRAQPELVESGKRILFDEWQFYPQVWNLARHAVDAGAAPGTFLFAGSATPQPSTTMHTGAARIMTLPMRPMGLHERGVEGATVSLAELLDPNVLRPLKGATSFTVETYAEEIARSGFPGLRDLPPIIRRAQLESYVDRIIDRELPEAGYGVRNPHSLRRWLEAYAAATATTTSYSNLLDAVTAGDGSQPTKRTTATYREQLHRIFVVDPIPGWIPTRNPLKRVGQAPKHFLADPALALQLLGHDERSILGYQGKNLIGALFEHLVALTVRTLAEENWAKTYHLRTQGGGHEIDLIVEGPNRQVVAIEIKLARTISDGDVKHLHWLRNTWDGDIADLVVINNGERAYRRPDGVAVVPLALLGA